MMSQEEAQRVLGAAVEAAKQGVESAEASLLGGTLGVARFADNEVHQQTVRDRELLSVRVVVAGRAGRAETTDLTLQGLRHVARQARLIAELMPPPKDKFELPGEQVYQSVDAFDADTERATPLDRMSLVGKAAISAHRHELLASGFVATRFGAVGLGPEGDGPYAIANSNGLFAYRTGTRATMSLTMMKKSGASGWSEAESVGLSGIDVSRLIQRASAKATFPGQVTELPVGLYTVVLEPAAVAGLMSFFARSVGAEQVEDGRSVLSGKLGERIAPPTINVSDDYSHPLHNGSPFDADGVAKKKVTLVDQGMAVQPLYSWESARKAGVPATGHKVNGGLLGEAEVATHLVMEGGGTPLSQLISGCPRGVLVTRFWYVRMVEPRSLLLTGVTRDGTFLIERGELTSPVANMRFNISLLDLFPHVQGMSVAEWAGGLVVPAMRVNDFFLSAPAPR